MTSPAFTFDSAQDLLDAFDVGDDPDSRAFLAELLASGAAPEEEVDVLCRGAVGTSTAAKTPKRSKRPRNLKTKYQKKDSIKSPFFKDRTVSYVEGADSSDGEDDSDIGDNDRPSRLTAKTQTVAILTRRTVVGGSPLPKLAACEEDDTLDILKREPLAPPLQSPTQPLGVSPSSKKAFSSPSPTSSPSKRIRQTTSHFFSPGRKKRRAVKTGKLASDENKGESSAGSSDDSTASGSSSSPPTPTPTPSPTKQSRRGLVSGLPFPPLDSPSFGLVQEQLANEPFWLLVALIFLTRVAGRVSLPVFWAIKEENPTPESLLTADCTQLIARMRHLGMSSVRCAAIQRYARRWIERPPRAGIVTKVKHYPPRLDGDITGTIMETVPDTDSQWEIGHITQGAYSIDSWRIFCRDRLLGLSTDWKGEATDDTGSTFQPEWMRVLPQDKELRACLRWMWMREGWDWDPKTGDRTVLSEDLRRAVNEGRVGYNNRGELEIVGGEYDDTLV